MPEDQAELTAAYPDDDETRRLIEQWFAPTAHDAKCDWSLENFFASLPLGALLAKTLPLELPALRELGSRPDDKARIKIVELLRAGSVVDALADAILPALAKLSSAEASVSAGLAGNVTPAALLKNSCIARQGDTLDLQDELVLDSSTFSRAAAGGLERIIGLPSDEVMCGMEEEHCSHPRGIYSSPLHSPSSPPHTTCSASSLTPRLDAQTRTLPSLTRLMPSRPPARSSTGSSSTLPEA